MNSLKILFIISVYCINISANDYIEDIKDAKVGECYKKVFIPAKYAQKDELIEVEKASEKLLVTNPKFESIEKNITVVPSFYDVKDSMALFERKTIKLPTNDKKIFYTIGKRKKIPLSEEFVNYVEKKGVDLHTLKVGECYEEYVKLAPLKVVKKEYIKKQAYEIIDVAPAKFKIVKKKIQIKPAYTKIIKTPAVYETQIVKVLVKPAKKTYITKKDGSVCVLEKPAQYKKIVKKILKTPPLTKVIKFPAVYKEIETKVLVSEPTVSRRVIPQKKDTYNFYVDGDKNIYFWSKKEEKGAKKTGLKICKHESQINYVEKNIEVVAKPATTKKVQVPPKQIKVKVEKLIQDANCTKIKIPAQYEKIKSLIMISPSKIVWKKIRCKDKKESAVK